jgi:transcriptional regulator with XRE-family HTH domain
MVQAVRESSITKLWGSTAAVRPAPNSDFSRRLGAIIRARRRELGLTQTQLGDPLTKGFVSEVERGRSLPSLAALVHLAERLAVPISYLFDEVNGGLPAMYTARDESDHASSAPGR